MPLFLISTLYDEGISPNLIRVVEAESDLEVATHILHHPHQWATFLYRTFGNDLTPDSLADLTPESLLERLNRTFVDGDSSAQMRITRLTVESLESIDTNPSFQPGALFSDFG